MSGGAGWIAINVFRRDLYLGTVKADGSVI